MKLKLDNTEKVLFALLRSALHETSVKDICWETVTEDEWKQCYKLASAHGVMALAWDGLQQLPKEKLLPRALRLTWGLAVQSYEEKYERYCRTVEELSHFYAQHHIAMVQIKGVGFSPYYPVPSHREGGDIDIYTWSADRSVRSDQEANLLANQLMQQQGIDVDTKHTPKHSNFYYKGIPIENHKRFLNIEKYGIAGAMDKLLYELLNPQLTLLCDGKYQINTPSPAFNALFISFHAAQHYGSGIRVHHLFDWACLLKRYGWCLPSQVTDERLLDFISALTYLCNELLGLDIPVKGGERMAFELFEQMMHPLYGENVPVKNKLGILWYKLKRLLHIYRLYAAVFDVSLSRTLWDSIVVHVRRPETIFQTKSK